VNAKENIPKILPPKIDVVFKMLFGDKRNKKILIGLLEAILEKKIQNVELLNPSINQKDKDDKLSILDVKVELASGEIIDIEMQVRNIPELRQRITYYSAGMIREQIGKAGKYQDIKPAISIIIVAETLIFESRKCHNVFLMLEREEHFPFNDLQETHILDLSRIENEGSELLSDWLKFINSEREEEFMAVAQKNAVIKAAYDELKSISADKHQRMLYEARLKQQRDVWSMTDKAEQRGRAEGRAEGEARSKAKIAKILKQRGMSDKEIFEITGLSITEIKA
jgi:predicted transposase/invertase (TIGR01784 family)